MRAGAAESLVVSCLALPCRRRMRKAAGHGHGRARQHEQGLPGLHSRTNHHLPLTILRLRAWRRVSPAMIPGRRLSPHGCSNRQRRPRFRYSKLSKYSRYRQAGRQAGRHAWSAALRGDARRPSHGSQQQLLRQRCCLAWALPIPICSPSLVFPVSQPAWTCCCASRSRCRPPSAAALALLAYQQALLDRERRGDVLCCC
jgi:hypothetical protein